MFCRNYLITLLQHYVTFFQKRSTFNKVQVHLIILFFALLTAYLKKNIYCFIYSKTNKAIHKKLICDLSAGFFDDSPQVSGNNDRWKEYCTQRYRLPAHQH